MNLGGSLMRQMERTMPLDPQSPHVINIGKLVEEHENKIRNTLNDIYFGKSRDIVNGLRYSGVLGKFFQNFYWYLRNKILYDFRKLVNLYILAEPNWLHPCADLNYESYFFRSITPLKDESAKRALAHELNKRLTEKPPWYCTIIFFIPEVR